MYEENNISAHRLYHISKLRLGILSMHVTLIKKITSVIVVFLLPLADQGIQ
jgi:hypothetical protein